MIPAEPLYVGRMSRGRTAALHLGGVGAVLRRGFSRALECDGSALIRGIELPLADGAYGGSHDLASLYSPYYCTALIMSKIGRYMATIIPPTTTPSTTIMIGSMAASSASTAASTSSS